MKAFRKLLQKTPLYGVYKTLGHYPDYWYWKLRGEPERTPHLVKQRTVIEYAETYGAAILVETGTYYGEMISAVKDIFPRIYSIEYDHALAQRAKKKFSRWPEIKILEGDSQKILPALLKEIMDPALFWLDAGYYGWAGLQGDKHRLITELEAILHHPLKTHVILMDDARGLNGQNGAPTVEELKRRIELEVPRRRVEVKHDILRITLG